MNVFQTALRSVQVQVKTAFLKLESERERKKGSRYWGPGGRMPCGRLGFDSKSTGVTRNNVGKKNEEQEKATTQHRESGDWFVAAFNSLWESRGKSLVKQFFFLFEIRRAKIF